MLKKYVYEFKEGNSSMNKLLGNKGANLAEMLSLELPIPEGFVITTEACKKYEEYKNTPENIVDEIFNHVEKLEKKIKGKNSEMPMLVSVRSGSSVSMPGMMDTILNLGLNDDTVEQLGRATNNRTFALDCYKRFIMMFGEVVKEIDKKKFKKALKKYREDKGYEKNVKFSEDDNEEIVEILKKVYLEEVGEEFITDPREQLRESINAIFKSWNNSRAKAYRRMNRISNKLGTAVVVQRMVFGNMDNKSGTAVLFSRNPVTGENKIYGEYLRNAQGEDVVAGTRTPKKFADMENDFPSIYEKIIEYAKILENHYKEVQDIEITIEQDEIYFLQTRRGKRTATAAMKIAVDLVEENILTKEEGLLSISCEDIERLLHPTFKNNEEMKKNIIGKGLPASPGAGAGKIYFTVEKAEEAYKKGEDVILVRPETSPDDIIGMEIAKGILTVHGGLTSHASVVARGMGKCCVCGCEEIEISEDETYFILNGTKYIEGQYISLDGSTGEIYDCKLETEQGKITGYFHKIMEWSDEIKNLKIKVNADTPKDVKKAIEFGAEGVGVVRSEHMFFEESKIIKIHQMIMADTKSSRDDAIVGLMPYQKEDFKGIFEEVKEKGSVTVRLLDPPLHEFLPTSDIEFNKLSDEIGISAKTLKNKAEELKETNPMMGHRGCRLASTYPEIPRMQTRAIIESAIEVAEEQRIKIVPEILVPLIVGIKEFIAIKKIIREEAEKVIEEKGVKLEYKIGAMIETPRSALIAENLAKESDFFSIGTNDLTQLTFSLSRDDGTKILRGYLEDGTFHFDPTVTIDVDGVGKLIEMSKDGGKKIKPNMEIGICGEHSSDLASILYFDKIGIDYISCTTYKIPVARLGTAQAAIINKMNNKANRK